MRSTRILLGTLVIALVAAACSSSTSGGGSGGGSKKSSTVVIGSTNFPEQLIVANLYASVLSHNGFKVTLKPNLGTREAVEPALVAGQLDLYPDYTGSLLIYLAPNDTEAATQTTTAVPALKAILKPKGVTVLSPSKALDTNVFAVTQATAAKYHLTTLSSLAPVASQLVLGGPPECPQRPLCEIGLANTYGLHFKSFTSLDEAGPITVAALKSGEVQVAELFSSDGSIVENNFVQLTDNKHLQPADYVIPVVRKKVLTTKMRVALNDVSAKLTTAQLEGLNIQVSVDHKDPASVAKAWLQAEGMI